MEKPSPFITATVASIGYFVILIILKYLLEKQNKELDLQGALLSTGVFWIVIFLVHYILEKRYAS